MAKRRKRAARTPARPRYPNLGTYLRKTRKTQTALALAVKLSQPQISRILRGQMIPRRAAARRLADYCSIPLESLYLGT